MSRRTGRGYEDKLLRELEEQGLTVMSFSTTSHCDLLVLPNVLLEVKTTKLKFFNCTLTKGTNEQHAFIVDVAKRFGYVPVYAVRFINGKTSHWEFFSANDGHIFRIGQGRLMDITNSTRLYASITGLEPDVGFNSSAIKQPSTVT